MDRNELGVGEGRIDRTIGERVMIIRRRREISQRNLAARAQMSPTALNRLERGLQSVSAERLATLARLLDVSADYLLGLSQEVRAIREPIPREDTHDVPSPRQAGRPHKATLVG
jgi:transcriptional regulator with XRE-family HTH domain